LPLHGVGVDHGTRSTSARWRRRRISIAMLVFDRPFKPGVAAWIAAAVPQHIRHEISPRKIKSPARMAGLKAWL
jgi:hypothetical protein